MDIKKNYRPKRVKKYEVQCYADGQLSCRFFSTEEERERFIRNVRKQITKCEVGVISESSKGKEYCKANKTQTLQACLPTPNPKRWPTVMEKLRTDLGVLHEGDCLTILPQIQDESIDLVFADPPFNLSKEYQSGMNDSLGDNEYIDWCKAWIDECIRCLSDGGAFFLYNLPKWNLALGSYLMERLTFRHWVAVDMKYTLPIQNRLYPSHYSMLYFIKGKKPKIFHPDRLPLKTCRHCGGELQDYGGYKSKMNPKGVNIADVWTDIPPVRHSRFKKHRGANMLSLKLLDRVIELASDKGSLVMDPFGGSGTTYVAAELKERRWAGIELDCSEIEARFKDLSDDQEYLNELTSRKNILFTAESLRLRAKSGMNKTNNQYRIEASYNRAEQLNGNVHQTKFEL